MSATPTVPVETRSPDLPSWLSDVLPAILVLPFAFIMTPLGPAVFQSLPAAGWLLASSAGVTVRRHRPRLAVLAVLAVVVGSQLTVGLLISPVIGLLVTVYSVGRRTNRRTTVALAVLVVLGTVVAAAALLVDGWDVLRVCVQTTGLVGFAAAAGDGTRSRAAYVAAILDRARRAEEGQEAAARRRVTEERLMIARDLHDVVAHQIAVINLQAGVASQTLRAQPHEAEQALATIREASRTVLAEIGSLLQVLRTIDPRQPTPTTGPVPGLSQLDELIRGFERSGLRVEQRRRGTPVALDPSVDVAAYRIVQEGLTNAHKHGNDACAVLHIDYLEETVQVRVVNTVAPDVHRFGRTAAGGHGLVGARERAVAVGGELESQLGPGSVHRLTAQLPLWLPTVGAGTP